ncbi:MAG: type IV toxin-antitoxin system AbiEi family antitoxin domain-containing protein [candidate division Zixibacteria bacterium]|nr:type IV toxin-antitoxin system AbiEi family antitoxin domain-containing protein [candidate division Zixibacteria bacterium]
MTGKATEDAIRILKKHGGVMRTSEAIEAGINRRTLYRMRDDGRLEVMSRGVYRLASAEPIGAPDIISVQKRIERGVICLISALHLHGITLQVPHYVYVAVNTRQITWPIRIDYPPTKIFRFLPNAFEPGKQTMKIDSHKIKVYSPEKTIADCFKHRNKIGLDVAVEALKLYKERKKVRVDKLMEYARVCRVEKVMKPYLEAIL